MSATDFTILIIILGGAVYGAIRGIRPTLFLLIAMLASLLGLLVFTSPLEGLLLEISPVNAEAYTDAPAVAAFILEGEDGFAYLAALLPVFFLAFFLFALILGGLLTSKYLTEPSRGAISRLLGTIAGILAGAILSLLLAVQLIRLPRPLAGVLFRESLVFSALNSVADHLLPGLAGGL